MLEEVPFKHMILYAEDDVDDVELVKEVFNCNSQDVEVVTVLDGLEALAFLKKLPLDEPAPCLIILDINMPLLNGKETLARIRSLNRYKDVPTILFTTSVQQVDKEFAKKFNAGFITKPIEYDQLDKIANKFIQYCTDEVKKRLVKSKMYDGN